MIENLIYLLVGLLLGLYLGVKRFRTPINNAIKRLFSFLGKLEFKGNRKADKPQDEIVYENFHNRGYYCVLPGHETLPCSYNGYCGNCPTYRKYKEPKEDRENNKPIGFDEDYWWGNENEP